MSLCRPVRVLVALAALIAGYAHLRLYADGYKDIPIANIGLQFLTNAVVAALIAVGLIAPLLCNRVPSIVAVATPLLGIGWAAMSLFAFWMSRTSSGWMGFNDGPGLNPAPEAALSVFPEIVVLVGCLTLSASAAVAKRNESALS